MRWRRIEVCKYKPEGAGAQTAMIALMKLTVHQFVFLDEKTPKTSYHKNVLIGHRLDIQLYILRL